MSGKLATPINRWIGNLLARVGYQIERTYRKQRSSMPVVEMAVNALLTVREQITLVQIGAFDGVTSDPVARWIGHPRIRAILVEPQPGAFEALKGRFGQRSNTTLLKAAIASENGTIALFVPNVEVASQVASLSQEHVRALSGRAESILVRAMTVRALLEESGTQHVDLLQVDTEGMDYDILLQFFALGIEPSVVNLESFHLSKVERNRLYAELDARGYAYLDHNLDTFAVKQDLFDECLSASRSSTAKVETRK